MTRDEFWGILLTLLLMCLQASVFVGIRSTVLAASAPGVEWNEKYGGTENDCTWHCSRASDGGYVFFGATYSFSSNDQGDAWVVKTNATGHTQWSKTYGGTGTDTAYSGEQTRDGGYIFSGYTEDSKGNMKAWLVKLDSSGNKVWSKEYEGEPNHTGAQSWAVRQTRDGGYIVAYYAFDNVTWIADSWLVKTDASGNTIWNRKYGDAGWDYIYSVQETTDGGYIFAGRTSSYSGGNLWIVKTTANGNVVWTRIYGGNARSVQQTRDGGYILAGDLGSSDGYLLKTDPSGILVWDQTYGGNKTDTAWAVEQTIDGGYVFTGYTYSFGANVEVWLVKTNANGTMEWSQTHGYGYGYSVHQTSDAGYILAGWAFGAGFDAFLLKLMGEDADGDGLLDSWEKEGIDYNNDGLTDFVLQDADWQHKDLFVEVDYIPGLDSLESAMDEVASAFANAPVDNPDGIPGIRLHIDLDEAFPFQEFVKEDFKLEFDPLKHSYFGTAEQRSGANSYNVLEAKKMVYRYCLMAYKISELSGTQWVDTGISGLGEWPGNDFMVAAGILGGRSDFIAGVFMHELGHNLGLHHGGGDKINYKPNYLSVMNYAFIAPTLIPWRPLDYSRKELPTLQEGALNEPVGIQGFGFWQYTAWNNSKRVYTDGLANGPLDWNGDGNFSYLVQANINNFPGWDYTSTPMELLVGYDDWAHVKLAFGTTENFLDGVHFTTDDGEITSDILEAMRQARMGMHEVGVYNVSSPSPVWSPGSDLSVNFALGNLGGSDENVNVAVYANATVVASSSLIVGAGNLTSVTLPYTGQALNPGTYTLKATVSQVAGETYTADNTATGGTVTVTDVIPEFSPIMILTTALLLTGIVAALSTRKKPQKEC